MSKDWHGDDIEPEDVKLEPEDNESPTLGGDPADKVRKLKEQIEHLQKEKQEYLDGWQRSKADYVNLLKRSDEGAKQQRERGVVEAVEALLPAFDALERAKSHGEVPKGFEAIAKQLEAAFAGLGLQAIGAVGEAFDPAKHEALGQDAAENAAQDDTISSVLESGWAIGDKVIRPAKVRVAKFA